MEREVTEQRLSPQDQARVERVISSGVNRVERAPFRPWRLLLVIWLVMVLLGLLSYFLAWYHGAV